jgi:hypothetical protein
LASYFGSDDIHNADHEIEAYSMNAIGTHQQILSKVFANSKSYYKSVDESPVEVLMSRTKNQTSKESVPVRKNYVMSENGSFIYISGKHTETVRPYEHAIHIG